MDLPFRKGAGGPLSRNHAAGPLLQRQRRLRGELPAGAALKIAQLAQGLPERGVPFLLVLGGPDDLQETAGLLQELPLVGGEPGVAAALGGADGRRPRPFFALDGLDKAAGERAGIGRKPFAWAIISRILPSNS